MSKNTFFKKRCHLLRFWTISAETTTFIVFPGLHCFGPKTFLAKTDSVHENARFSPFLTQIVSGNFCKSPFLYFSHFWMTTLKNTIFIGFWGPFSISFFSLFFLFLFLQHRKDKNKKCNFFSKTSFLTSRQFAETLFWHNVTLFVVINIPPKHYQNGEKRWKKNLDQFLTLSLDQLNF